MDESDGEILTSNEDSNSVPNNVSPESPSKSDKLEEDNNKEDNPCGSVSKTEITVFN